MGQEKNIAILYMSSTIMLVLIAMLLIQIYKKNKVIKRDVDKKYLVYVNTNKGIVKMDNETAANELETINKQLANVSSVDESLTPMIKDAIIALEKFNRENPKNGESLCKLEMRSKIIDQGMSEFIVPNGLNAPSNDPSGRHLILEWDAEMRRMQQNPHELLRYLVQNIDIAVAMFRREICDNGQLDVKALYGILNSINQHIKDKGQDYVIDHVQTIEEHNDKYVHADTNMDRTSFIPIFNREVQTLEPMTVGPSNIEKTAGPTYANDQPTGMGSTLLDKSLEGSVEMDYLGYKPPGHIISHLYDKSDHYTVNVNACLGKIVSDDVFITELHGNDLSESKHYQQCGQHDVNAINALNGRPEKMLDCVGDCYSLPNYTRFYSKFPPAIHDAEKFNDLVN